MTDAVFAKRRYMVMGLGRNGLAAARRLTALGAEVVCWDDSQAGRAGASGVAVRDPGDLSGFDALVLSPGIADSHPLARDALARSIPILSDAALLHEAVRLSGSRARFVGITGTNGKSTTTVLLAHLLGVAGIEAVAGGNLGPAALGLPLLGDDGVYVLEMSSYMLERVPQLHFDAAALLNISPDHLERHGGFDGYVAAKRQVFANRRAGDCAVIGIDDAASRELASLPDAVTISGEDDAADWFVRHGKLVGRGRIVADITDTITLRGRHNGQNAAAASAVASHLGVSDASVAAGLRSFAGLAHRQKHIGDIEAIAFIDDSKATNAQAAARALESTAGALIWIAGGLAKDGGIDAIVEHLGGVREAILIGRDAPMFARTLQAAGIAYRIAGTLEKAVPAAFDAAMDRGAATVLLSPAAASFDQFADFEERGRRFGALFGALAEARGAGRP